LTAPTGRSSAHPTNPLVFQKRHNYKTESGDYEKGENAMVNALLLSKCETLIRTTSLLSAWASLFNPQLKFILLNKAYDNRTWYPETEIIMQASTEYCPETFS
jgi:hypothetical protein